MHVFSADGKAPQSGASPAGRTRFVRYPSISLSKLEVSLSRAQAVHAGFDAEVAAMGNHIHGQAELAEHALGHCRTLRPLVAELAAALLKIGEDSDASRAFVREGSERLRSSVARVKDAIDGIRRRTEEMRDILRFSEQIAQRVNDIADIAIENKVIAINASISASKAGERVRGFKVIAAEITRMSAAMAERVDAIVASAAAVGERVSRIMAQMDGSVRSTEDALRSIDEAFALLADIDETIVGTEAQAGAMKSENESLARDSESLATAVAEVRASIAEAERFAASGSAAIAAQSGRLNDMARTLPGAARTAEALARIEAAEQGGEKTLVMTELPLTVYDPALGQLVREYHYSAFTCVRLVRYSSDRRLVPYLAEYWTLLPDGRTWDFVLRKGVTFFDGSPVGAEDVKFSLERLMNPKLGSPYAALLSIIEGADEFFSGEASEVSGIRILDAHRLRFVLKDSFNYFLGILANGFSSIVKKNPEHFSRPLSREEIMSAGPFRSVRGEDGAADVLEANPRFLDGPAFMDRLVIRRDVSDIPGALRNGTIDFVYNVPYKVKAELESRGFKGRYQSYVSRYCNGIVINFRSKSCLARRVELRRAFAMAIDKDALVRAVYGDTAIRAETVLLREILDMGGKVLLPYDPEEARRIVESFRGVEDLDAEISLAVVQNLTMAGADHACALIAAYAAKVGLRIKVVHLDASKAEMDEYRKYDCTFMRFMPDQDLYTAFEPFVNPEGGDNYFGYDNPAMLEELRRSIGIQDEGDRRRFFVDFAEKFTLDVFLVPILFLKTLAVAKDDLRSVVLAAEETFFPELIWREPGEIKLGSAGASGADARALTENISRSARAIAAETATVSAGAEEATQALEKTMGIISSQRREIEATEERLGAITDWASRLQERRGGVVAAAQAASGKSRRSAEAARIILESLGKLSSDLSGTASSLDYVVDSIAGMIRIVEAVEGYNSVIGSVAVNAAIIATRDDSRERDLSKVAKSIADLARLNGENTDAIAAILTDTEKSVAAHSVGVRASLADIDASADEIGSSGAVLERVAPLLASAESNAGGVMDVTMKLLALVEDTAEAVKAISDGSRAAAAAASALRVGVDRESAVVSILKDNSHLAEQLAELFESAAKAAGT